MVLAVTGALALSVLAPGLTSPARAAVSDSPAATYQTDDRVSAILVVGNRLYIAGRFKNVRPAGVAAGGADETARSGLAAFNLTTGALLPWNPGVNHQVNALAASPNGRVIYVGGRFGRIHGKHRANLAAVRARSGKLTHFRADTNGRVLSIATRGRAVYVGGKFTNVSGRAVGHLAALTRRGHVRSSFHGSADGFVRSVAISTNGRFLYLGGDFRHVSGKRGRHLAKLVRVSGRARHMAQHPSYPVLQVVATKHRLYLAGNGVGGHLAAYTTTGTRRWVRQVDGRVTSVARIRKTLYAGGQFHHMCVGDSGGVDSGFTCPTVQATRQRLVAVSRGTGALRAWAPGANSILGVFAMAGSSAGLQVGGDFTTIGSTEQQGYARFDLP